MAPWIILAIEQLATTNWGISRDGLHWSLLPLVPIIPGLTPALGGFPSSVYFLPNSWVLLMFMAFNHSIAI